MHQKQPYHPTDRPTSPPNTLNRPRNAEFANANEKETPRPSISLPANCPHPRHTQPAGQQPGQINSVPSQQSGPTRPAPFGSQSQARIGKLQARSLWRGCRGNTLALPAIIASHRIATPSSPRHLSTAGPLDLNLRKRERERRHSHIERDTTDMTSHPG